MPASSVPRPGRASRVVAATLATALSWGVFSAVVAIGAHDQERLRLASAARQAASATALAASDLPTPGKPLVVALSAPNP